MSGVKIAAITGGRRDQMGGVLIPSSHQMERFFLLLLSLSPARLRHGNAIGTDRYVADFLRSTAGHGCKVDPFPVLPEDGQWPLAGHRRNARMLQTHPPVSVLFAFPGGSGTAHCVETGLRMGIQVWQWEGGREWGEFKEIAR